MSAKTKPVIPARPWVAGQDKYGAFVMIPRPSSNFRSAMPNQEAANLAAAAPDLFDALLYLYKEVCIEWSKSGMKEPNALMVVAGAAINKAAGVVKNEK